MTIHHINGEDQGTNCGSIQNSSTMSLTYADFLYPQQSHQNDSEVPDFGGSFGESFSSTQFRGSSSSVTCAGSSSCLPSEFQKVIKDSPVPLLQNFNEADQDFIIIAEFSELEGPIPICTIPSNAPEKTDINLNSLAVHLMSTDYQVNTVGQFGVCKDTQVLRTNVFLGVHVFMQYFTLYDIKARGFVRPFCYGYVSKDYVKLDRMVKNLIGQFNEVTEHLKYSNREWFAAELTEYLKKLREAKENFISRTSSNSLDRGIEFGIILDGEQSFEEDSECITLNQLAHQYMEIDSILETIKEALNNPPCVSKGLPRIKASSGAGADSKLHNLLEKLGFLGSTFSALYIPLVHPLKQKSESLRPMTYLGQLGTIALVLELKRIYEENCRDLIFTEMNVLTDDFHNHFFLAKGSSVTATPENSNKANNYRLEMRGDEIIENEVELCKILETIHASVPIVPSDSKSASYHSFSTEESEVTSASTPQQTSGESSYKTGTASMESTPSTSQDCQSNLQDSVASNFTASATSTLNRSNSPINNDAQLEDFLCHADMNSSWTIIEPRVGIPSSSGEKISDSLQLPSETEEPIEIQKESWWSYGAKSKLQKGDPGYGIRKFCVHFPKVAHHLLFSILVGRPIILFGTSKYRSKVSQIISALIPFVPCYPMKTFKIFRWHQGILVKAHLDGSHKLIGLCIPERLKIHDLINPRDQNSITLFDVENRKIFGPAYSGKYLRNFETNPIQKHFFDDLSLLCFLGSILTDIEAEVYMIKAMQCEGKLSFPKIMKELDLKSSDVEISKYLSSLVADPPQCINLF